jgi:hypothetical protein
MIKALLHAAVFPCLLWLAAACGNGNGGEADTATEDAPVEPDRVDIPADPEVEETVDTAGDEEAHGDAPDAAEDVTEEDVTGSGDTQAYGACDSTEQCQPGYTCETYREDPLYGQCTRRCVSETDCPPAPAESSVGCSSEHGTCFVLCGIHEGECPEWLECVAYELCMEPVSTVADKGPGELCSDEAECMGDAECVALGDSPAYCAPLCTIDEDCAEAAAGSAGMCQDAGLFAFCMFQCRPFAAAECPGDLLCVFGLCLTEVS